VRVAERWRGTRYDYTHSDDTWKNIHAKPARFDCSTFVCRIAMEALGLGLGELAADAAWLLDHFVEVESPQPGDLVGYGRAAVGEECDTRDVVWHVMLYRGTGSVIGACDIAGEVMVRPMEYTADLGDRQWRLIETPPFRTLTVR
jgi:cell wall-associated NlpC family hydrolase